MMPEKAQGIRKEEEEKRRISALNYTQKMAQSSVIIISLSVNKTHMFKFLIHVIHPNPHTHI